MFMSILQGLFTSESQKVIKLPFCNVHDMIPFTRDTELTKIIVAISPIFGTEILSGSWTISKVCRERSERRITVIFGSVRQSIYRTEK